MSIEYTHDELERAAQAHAKRRAELNGEEPPERPVWMRQPHWVNRCAFCGDAISQLDSHCDESAGHSQEEPECPACHDAVDDIRTVAYGIETIYWKCTNCNWQSDPE